MSHPCSGQNCDDCTRHYLCRCLQVTEETIRHAIETLKLTTLQEIKEHTGAGDGCMACTKRLLRFLNDYHAVHSGRRELATLAG